MRSGGATPFATGVQPRKGTPLQVVSYGRDREARPSLQELCQVLGRPGGVLVTSCLADFGSSGAPIFATVAGHPTIVAVVSSRAEIAGRRVSLGAALEPALSALRARAGGGEDGRALRQASGPDGTLTPGGAKFLRP